jgi:hypothetical protein
MAGVYGRYTNATGIALTGTTAKTIIQITAPANQLIILRELTLGFQRTTGTFADGDDFKIRILVQSTAGTMTGATEVHHDSGRNLTLQAAVTHTASAEPTAGNELWTLYGSLYRQSNVYRSFIVPGGPSGIYVVENTRVGIEITADVDTTVYPSIVWEE